MLPVGNESLLERNINILKNQGIQDIYVIGKQSAVLKRIAVDNFCVFEEMQNEIFLQIAGLEIPGNVLIMYGSLYLEDGDMAALVQYLDQGTAAVLGRPWKEQESGFGACPDGDRIHTIYGHPRDHYVDTRIFGACVLPKSWISALQYTVRGAGVINCGQMPDEQYYLESALGQMIGLGMELHVYICERPVVQIRFPWELFEANRYCCRTLSELKEDCIGAGSMVQDVYRKQGFLKVGKNCRIRRVTFEGNCVIGDNVVLEDGAVIGNNCMIGSGSVIRHSCMIHEETVIGPGNKVDFGAEISGVTMEGTAAVHGCEVFGVVGRYVDIAAGVVMAVLRFDDAQVPRRVNGRVYRSAYTNCVCIGDYTRTGVHTTFLPGVSVGSRCAVGPGVLVEKDVRDNTLLLLRQETVQKEWGSARYGWQ
ncbi:hypothetical protein [Lachnoclostridium sp. An76]|uniref:hypothetical protein n=1 Tax=Lachnoclostridium sp. An76 TaxID=1965654 RepID=UPI0013A627CB|nr:hypothetical protein [Lachnoclostridium sp. An76]